MMNQEAAGFKLMVVALAAVDALLEVPTAAAQPRLRSPYADLPADERAMREQWDEETRRLAQQARLNGAGGWI
jgi:hypothetical protein